jgi:uncharacterized damage-inducible protein DinB
MTGEMQILTDSLSVQRAHVIGILENLTDEQLRRAVLPSGWSCLDLVHHLALDVEHYWFRCIVAGESLDFFPPHESNKPGAWKVGPEQTAGDILDLYREEIREADAVIASSELEAAPRQLDAWWGDWNVPNVRFIILHVITETACHAGHLDAAREILDGRQWLVL